VRYASHKGPSAWEETCAYLRTLQQNFELARLFRRSRGVAARARLGHTLTVSDLHSIVTWREVAALLSTDPELRKAEVIHPQSLARALGVSRDVADLLIADAAFSAGILQGESGCLDGCVLRSP